MKILAIDSATTVMGVAVTDQGKVLSEYTTNLKRNHSIRLMPAIEQVMKDADLAPQDIDRIAASIGPGSYTGVRIGVSIAKTLAWSLKKELVGISTLACMAQNGALFNGILAPFFDARRDRVYSGLYTMGTKGVESEAPDQIRSVEDWLDELAKRSEPILFISHELAPLEARISERLGSRAFFAPDSLSYPRPSELAALASEAPPVQSIHHFVPEYLQMAEAEAKWQANQKGLN